MKHTIKLLTLAFMLATILTLTGCPGPVNTIEPPVWDDGVVTTEPTCTEEGVKTYTCSNGETRTETIPALGHDMGEWEITKNPTCTEKGSKTRKCSRCGKTETVEIDALGHDWVLESDTADCTTAGVKTYHCSRCNETKTIVSPTLGHDYQGGYCEREGCTDPWEHSNRKDIRVYSSEAAFKNDYGSSTSTTNAMRGVPYETLHFSFEKEVSNVEMPLNKLLHLKSDYSGYKVKKYANEGLRITSYNDSTEEVALTNLAALLIEPITN